MSAFKRYHSKPIVRLAYQIKEKDLIYTDNDESDDHFIDFNGERLTFVAHQEVKAGDYIVYLNESDIYHCSKQVFEERNEVY